MAVANRITFDQVSNSGAKSASSSFSWTHTPVGTPDLVVVCISSNDATSANTAVSSVTYGGVDMPQINDQVSAAGFVRVSTHLLTSPASGAQTVAVTMAGSNANVAASALTFIGSWNNNANVVDGNNGGTGASGDLSQGVTSTRDYVWYVTCVVAVDTTINATGTNETERTNLVMGTCTHGVSTSEVQPRGSYTPTWTNNSGTWCELVCLFRPHPNPFTIPNIGKIRPRPFAPGLAR